LLTLSDGAPLRALSWIASDYLGLRNTIYDALSALSIGKADPLQLAAKMTDVALLSVVDLVLCWLADILRFQLTDEKESMVNQDYGVQLQHLSALLSRNSVLAYEEFIRQSRAILLTSVSLNKQLFLEDLWIKWVAYVSR
jgi:DNA polymerase III, delta subunit, C terminal.